LFLDRTYELNIEKEYQKIIPIYQRKPKLNRILNENI